MAEPDLTILIPVYNAQATLARTLHSLDRIAPQHRQRVQVVLVNDGSTDSSGQLMRELLPPTALGGVVHLDKPNGGSASARNAGLRAAQGRWMMFLDADDELAFDPVPYLDQAGQATALIFPVMLWKNGRPFSRHQPRYPRRRPHLDLLTAENPFFSPCVLFRRDRIEHPFDERFIYLEDWLFWIMNAGIFERVEHLPDVHAAIIHAHGGNKSAAYERIGRYRAQVAQHVLEQLGGRLTPRQRNNLLIQQHIGRILQGHRPRLSAFLHLPCDPRLWGKLLIYSTLRRGVSRFDFYGS